MTAERYLTDALSSDLVGVIGPCIGLPYLSHALAEWAAQSGKWQTALDAIQPLLVEALRRDLPFDRVQVQFDYASCLEGAEQVGEAESVFFSILPEVTESQFYRLHHQVDQALAAHFDRLGLLEQAKAYIHSNQAGNSPLQ